MLDEGLGETGKVSPSAFFNRQKRGSDRREGATEERERQKRGATERRPPIAHDRQAAFVAVFVVVCGVLFAFSLAVNSCRTLLAMLSVSTL